MQKLKTNYNLISCSIFKKHRLFLFGWVIISVVLISLFYSIRGVTLYTSPAKLPNNKYGSGTLVTLQAGQLHQYNLKNPNKFTYFLSFLGHQPYFNQAIPVDYKLRIQQIQITSQLGQTLFLVNTGLQTRINDMLSIGKYKFVTLQINQGGGITHDELSLNARQNFFIVTSLLILALLANTLLTIIALIVMFLLKEPLSIPTVIRDKNIQYPFYRPDIDGLRALAVSLVILFHINSSLMPGGFVGVDVFFVISGFLITGITYKSIENGSFRFKLFYARRIRRILPLMYTMLAATFIVGIFLFNSDELLKLAEAVKANVFYQYNFYILNHGKGYFDISSLQQPLLHTWSLAVEEQFYFIMPLLLVLLYKLSRNKLVLCLGITVITILSMGFSVYASHYLPQIAYYMLPSRAYELCLGALLAISLGYIQLIYNSSQYRIIFNKFIASIISISGLLLIMLASLLLNESDKFPGWYGLLPTLGTVLFILGGSLYNNNILARIFSHKYFVGVGLMSYSLYLWHWPILAYYRYENPQLQNKIGLQAALALILIILCVAVITYKYIEKPIKNTKLVYKTMVVRYQLIPAIIIVVGATYCTVLISNGGRIIKQTQWEIQENIFYPYGFCHGETHGKTCIFGQDNTKATHIAMYGDSHAGALTIFFDRLGKHNNFSLFMRSQSTCPPLLLNISSWPTADPLCIEERQIFKDTLSRYKTIVLVGKWSEYIDKPNSAHLSFITEFDKTLSYLYQQHKNVVVIGDVPIYPPGTIELIQRGEYLHDAISWVPSAKNVNLTVVNSRDNQIIERICLKYPNVHYFDMQTNIADKLSTYPYLGGYLLYYDSDHLNAYGSELLEQFFARQSSYDQLVEFLTR